MNAFTAKKLAVVLGLALLLSLAVIRSHSISNVPFCHYAAGCRPDAQPRGKIATRTYGYPLAYRQVQIFNPANSNEKSRDYAGYAETRVESQAFSLPSVIVNVIFWFALLHLLSRFVRPTKTLVPKAAPTPEQS
jgi:hypothetical protein